MSNPTELRESRLRSVLKAITYRITGTLTTMGLAYAVTGEVAFQRWIAEGDDA